MLLPLTMAISTVGDRQCHGWRSLLLRFVRGLLLLLLRRMLLLLLLLLLSTVGDATIVGP